MVSERRILPCMTVFSCCRRPAIDDITGQAMTWTSGFPVSSVDSLSSSAVLGQDMQLSGATPLLQQVRFKLPINLDTFHPKWPTLMCSEFARLLDICLILGLALSSRL